jgi:hypothetical protein
MVRESYLSHESLLEKASILGELVRPVAGLACVRRGLLDDGCLLEPIALDIEQHPFA